MPAIDLPTVWAFIIAFAIFAYVVMDGFDLGIGILFSWIPAGRERDTAKVSGWGGCSKRSRHHHRNSLRRRGCANPIRRCHRY